MMEEQKKLIAEDWNEIKRLWARDGLDADFDFQRACDLVWRNLESLGYTLEQAQVFVRDRESFWLFVSDARERIMSGSRRLGTALIASHEKADSGDLVSAREILRSFVGSETVGFYRELAEIELEGFET